MIIRGAAVRAVALDTEVAINASDSCRYNRLARRAGSNPGRYQGREIRLQIGNKRVCVDALEQIGGVVANVTSFHNRVLGEFALKAKRPGVNTIRSEVR